MNSQNMVCLIIAGNIDFSNNEMFSAGSIQEKLRTAELYKEARSLLKEANEFNIMDIPETRRSEIRDKRQNMMKLEKSAQDRLIAICRFCE